MKRGAINLSEIDNNSHKKQKITKSFDILLQEINNGNFDNFRSFLIQENMTSLNLSVKAGMIVLMQLGLALKDTKVHTLVLANNNIGADDAVSLCTTLKDTQVQVLDLGYNNIGPDGAARLGVALKGTNVRTLKLGNNNIGVEGAARLGATLKDTQIHILYLGDNNLGDEGSASLGEALKGTQVHTLYLESNNIGDNGAASLGKALKKAQVHTLYLGISKIGIDGLARLTTSIPDTLLFNVLLMQTCHYIPLKAALKKNHWEKRLSPYYVASLQHLPENEKNQYYNLPEVTNETALQFAGGIFMALGQKGCEGLQNKILSYLPSVSPTLAYQYQLATAQTASKKQATTSKNTDMKIERSLTIR